MRLSDYSLKGFKPVSESISSVRMSNFLYNKPWQVSQHWFNLISDCH